MNLLAQIGIGAALLALVAGAWQLDRHHQFNAGRDSLATELREKAAQDALEKERDNADRREGVARAEKNQSERARAQGAIDAKRQAIDAAMHADAVRVRDELRAIGAAGPRDPPAAGGTCEARVQRLEYVLSKGAGLLDEGVGLAIEGSRLVGDGAAGFAAADSLTELCREFDRSIRLQRKADPTTMLPP